MKKSFVKKSLIYLMYLLFFSFMIVIIFLTFHFGIYQKAYNFIFQTTLLNEESIINGN